MSKMTNEYGFMATDEGGGDVTLCDALGGGIVLTKGIDLLDDIASYIRATAHEIAEEIVAELEDES